MNVLFLVFQWQRTNGETNSPGQAILICTIAVVFTIFRFYDIFLFGFFVCLFVCCFFVCGRLVALMAGLAVFNRKVKRRKIFVFFYGIYDKLQCIRNKSEASGVAVSTAETRRAEESPSKWKNREEKGKERKAHIPITLAHKLNNIKNVWRNGSAEQRDLLKCVAGVCVCVSFFFFFSSFDRIAKQQTFANK